MPYMRFEILDQAEPGIDYNQRSFYDIGDCISVNDDFFDHWYPRLFMVKSYFHRLGEPKSGLSRYGVTLIPPESLPVFFSIVNDDPASRKSEGLTELLRMIYDASRSGKWLIHYGI